MRIDRMKEEYQRMGLCQKTFADALSVSKQAVSAWELGRQNPSIALLSDMAKLFGCSTDYLLGRTDERD